MVHVYCVYGCEDPANEALPSPSLPLPPHPHTHSQLGESPQCAKVLHLCEVVVLQVKVSEGGAGGEGVDARDEIIIEVQHCEIVADRKTFL